MVRTSLRAAAMLIAVILAVLLSGCLAGAAYADVATGSLVIRAVTRPADASAEFTFSVTCSGAAAAFERTVVVPTAGGVGTATVAGIPLDAACLVIDRAAAGWRVDTDNPQAVVASAEGTTVEFAHSAPSAARLSLVKTSVPAGASAVGAVPPAVRRGATVTYLLTYRNEGDLAADATISDQIPAGTSYAGHAVCQPACTRQPVVAAGRIRFAVPVDGGSTGSVSYAVRVAEDAADGDVIGSAATIDPGRRRSGVVLHRVVVPAAGLRVAVLADTDNASAGGVVGYRIDVTNSSFAAQSGVTVTDVVPTGAEYVAGSAVCPMAGCAVSYDVSAGAVMWRIGSLGAGATAGGLTFRVRIKELVLNSDGSLPGTVLLNRASASSSVTATASSNQIATVVGGVLGRKTVRRSPTAKLVRAAAVPTLPATGVPVGTMLALGAGLVIAGGALLMADRRVLSALLLSAGREPSAARSSVPGRRAARS